MVQTLVRMQPGAGIKLVVAFLLVNNQLCCALRTPGDISTKKCKEYADYVYEIINAPVLILNAPKVKRYECGQTVEKLIVGGEEAKTKEFPHMAAIGYELTPGDIQYQCGGTILNNLYILTAAHCLSHSYGGNASWVTIGVTDLNNSSNSRQKLKISELIPHPEYTPSSHYHDIGLIKLEKPARMNPSARPACLYTKQDVTAERAIATGWGKTSWSGESSSKLLKVTLEIFDHESCNRSYFESNSKRKIKKGIIKEMQICAGSKSEEKDTCQGDSGGPLQVYHVNDGNVKCMYDIIGVTSFGNGCFGKPGVYTRVSRYVKWIEDIVWPETQS